MLGENNVFQCHDAGSNEQSKHGKGGGPLACGLGGLLGVSLLSILYPGSAALRSIWLYGGLGLFSAFVLFDVQHIMHRAKTQHVYDPISGSISIYMDAVNLFVRFAMILGNSKRK